MIAALPSLVFLPSERLETHAQHTAMSSPGSPGELPCCLLTAQVANSAYRRLRFHRPIGRDHTCHARKTNYNGEGSKLCGRPTSSTTSLLCSDHECIVDGSVELHLSLAWSWFTDSLCPSDALESDRKSTPTALCTSESCHKLSPPFISGSAELVHFSTGRLRRRITTVILRVSSVDEHRPLWDPDTVNVPVRLAIYSTIQSKSLDADSQLLSNL